MMASYSKEPGTADLPANQTPFITARSLSFAHKPNVTHKALLANGIKNI